MSVNNGAEQKCKQNYNLTSYILLVTVFRAGFRRATDAGSQTLVSRHGRPIGIRHH